MVKHSKILTKKKRWALAHPVLGPPCPISVQIVTIREHVRQGVIPAMEGAYTIEVLRHLEHSSPLMALLKASFQP